VIQFLAAATGRGPESQDFARVLVPLLILAALVVLAWVLIAAIRKRLRNPGPTPSTSYSLDQLRHMRTEGMLSEDEYERARDQLVGHSQQKTPQQGVKEGKPTE
jgi:hypothetical protein